MIYWGIKSKNNKLKAICSRNDFMEHSESCKDIVTHLQRLKENNAVYNETNCKVKLQNHEDKLIRMGNKLEQKHGLVNNLYLSPEQKGYVDEMPESPVFNLDAALPSRTEEIVRSKAEAFKKTVLKKLFEPPVEVFSVFSGARKAKEPFAECTNPLDLPQVKALLKSEESNQAEVNALILSSTSPENHLLLQRYFGQSKHIAQ